MVVDIAAERGKVVANSASSVLIGATERSPSPVFRLFHDLMWAHVLQTTQSHPLLKEIRRSAVYQQHAPRAFPDVSSPSKANDTLSRFLRALVDNSMRWIYEGVGNVFPTFKAFQKQASIHPDWLIGYLKTHDLTQLADCFSKSNSVKERLSFRPMLAAIRDTVLCQFPEELTTWNADPHKLRIAAADWNNLLSHVLGQRQRYRLGTGAVLLVQDDSTGACCPLVERQVSEHPVMRAVTECDRSFVSALQTDLARAYGPRHTGGRDYKRDPNPPQRPMRLIAQWHDAHPLLGSCQDAFVWRSRERLFFHPSGCSRVPPYPISPVTAAVSAKKGVSTEQDFIANMVTCLFGGGIVQAKTASGKTFYKVAHQMPLDEGDHINCITIEPHLHHYEIMSLLTITEWFTWYHDTKVRLGLVGVTVKVHIPRFDYMVEEVGNYYQGLMTLGALHQMLSGVHARALAFEAYLGHEARLRGLRFTAISPYDGISRVFQYADGSLRPASDIVGIFNALGTAAPGLALDFGAEQAQRYTNVLADVLRHPDRLDAIRDFGGLQATPGKHFLQKAWGCFPVESGQDVDFTVLQQFGNVAVLLTTNLLQQHLYVYGVFPFLVVYPDSELPPLVEFLKLLRTFGLEDHMRPITESLMVYLSPMGGQPSLYQEEHPEPQSLTQMTGVVKRCSPHLSSEEVMGAAKVLFNMLDMGPGNVDGTVVAGALPSTLGMYGSESHDSATVNHALPHTMPSRWGATFNSEIPAGWSPGSTPPCRRRSMTGDSQVSQESGVYSDSSRPVSPAKSPEPEINQGSVGDDSEDRGCELVC